MQILYNARIHTLDSASPSASAIAIQDGRILATGNTDRILAEFKDKRMDPKDLRDMRGKVILPGLIDAHIHLEKYSFLLLKVDCETSSLDECLRRVADRARQTPAGEWIIGHGWNQNEWPEGFGNAAMLDRAAPNHPVYLTAKSLHAAWANSTALHIAGISSSTPDPEGGQILRNERGEPTGILLESAMKLVDQIMPNWSEAVVAEAILRTQPVLWQMGLTGVHDFDQRCSFTALQMLDEKEQLRLRVVKSIPHADLSHAAALGLRTGFGSDFLRIGSAKLFADGALGPRTAAMLQPYEDTLDNTGVLLLDEEDIVETGRQAVSNGISLAVHAIGDLANHAVLNAYAQLRHFEAQEGLPALRHRIEHVQIIHPSDAGRLAQLGVIASMQPLHSPSDMISADLLWGSRAANAYAWRTILDHQTALAFGSDAPVESPNPFWGLHAALTRRRADGSPGEDGWYPEQRITLLEALRGYTTGAAYAAGLEKRQGKLAPGYFADLIVLDEDPFQVSPSDLYHLQPVGTLVAGEWVWESEPL